MCRGSFPESEYWEVEVEFKVQDHFLPQNEFKTSLTDIRSCLNKKERKGRKGRRAKGSKLESVVVPFPPKQNTLALSCLSPPRTLVVSAA